VCCGVLQCVAVCVKHDVFIRNVMPSYGTCVAVCFAVCCGVLQCVAVCVKHDVFIRNVMPSYGTCLLHVLHASFISLAKDTTCLSKRKTTHSYETWCIHMWHDAFIYDISFSYMTSLFHIWHLFFIYDISFLYMTSLFYIWHLFFIHDIFFSYMPSLFHAWHAYMAATRPIKWVVPHSHAPNICIMPCHKLKCK